MSHLILIGAPEGPSYVGLTRKPKADLARSITDRRVPMEIVGQWDCGSEAAGNMALKIVQNMLRDAEVNAADGWWAEEPGIVKTYCEDAVALLEEPVDIPSPSQIITRIREDVFKTNQSFFAHVAGVSTSQVSRWESGHQEPSWRALMRIRQFALAAHLEWSDTDLFDLPAPSRPNGVVVHLDRARGSKHG